MKKAKALSPSKKRQFTITSIITNCTHFSFYKFIVFTQFSKKFIFNQTMLFFEFSWRYIKKLLICIEIEIHRLSSSLFESFILITAGILFLLYCNANVFMQKLFATVSINTILVTCLDVDVIEMILICVVTQGAKGYKRCTFH